MTLFLSIGAVVFCLLLLYVLSEIVSELKAVRQHIESFTEEWSAQNENILKTVTNIYTDLVLRLQKTEKSAVLEAAEGELDPLYEDAKQKVCENSTASTAFLQRTFKIGYARAARLLDELEQEGVIGPGNGAEPREVFSEK